LNEILLLKDLNDASELNVKTNVEFQVDESKKPPLVIDEENKAKLRVGPSPEVKRLFKRFVEESDGSF